MALKTFYVGAKAVIRTDRGVLLIRHAGGWWDMPGGRLDDNEELEEALAREIREELPGAELSHIHGLAGAHRVQKDVQGDISLVLVYYYVSVNLPEKLQLSEEHDEYLWVKSADLLPEPLNPKMADIVKKTLEKG